MEPVDNQLYLSSDDPDLAHAQNVRNQSVPNIRLTSTSQDHQTNQMQLHNHNGGTQIRLQSLFMFFGGFLPCICLSTVI